jgi:high-affinity nickel-transport protein
VAVALVIGTVELLGLLAQQLNLGGPFWDWISGLDINLLGFGIAGLFIATWAISFLVWRLGRIEEKWTAKIRPVEAGTMRSRVWR